MYKAKYIVQKNSNAENSSYVLKAKFRFLKHFLGKYWDKSTEKELERVTDRVELNKKIDRLPQYLIRKEKLNYHKKQGFNSHLFVDGSREVKISKSLLDDFFLGFHLKVHAKGNFPLEKLFNLKALEKFVLRE